MVLPAGEKPFVQSQLGRNHFEQKVSPQLVLVDEICWYFQLLGLDPNTFCETVPEKYESKKIKKFKEPEGFEMPDFFKNLAEEHASEEEEEETEAESETESRPKSRFNNNRKGFDTEDSDDEVYENKDKEKNKKPVRSRTGSKALSSEQ